MTILIDTGILKGALLHTTKKHRVEYNAVHITASNDIVMVEATDGHTLFRHVFVNDHSEPYSDSEWIIHADVIKQAITGRKNITIDGDLINDCFKFKNVADRYLQTDRVIPKYSDFGWPNNPIHFDFELLDKCQKSIRLATGLKDKYAISNPTFDGRSSVIQFKDIESPFCLIMALNIK